MHVAVQHRISDPEEFFSTDAQEVADNAPAGVKPRQFFRARTDLRRLLGRAIR